MMSRWPYIQKYMDSTNYSNCIFPLKIIEKAMLEAKDVNWKRNWESLKGAMRSR